MLYAGTENAIYVSFNNGETWQPLQNNLPHAPVSGIVVQEHFNDLVISTYGRGFWIIDDIGALRELTPECHREERAPVPRSSDVSLPAHHRALHHVRRPHTRRQSRVRRVINYYLKSAATDPMTITDRIREGRSSDLNGPGTPGLHRVYWNLRSAPSKRVETRTSPLYSPEIEVGPDGIRRSGGGFGGVVAG